MTTPTSTAEQVPLDGLESIFCHAYDATGDGIGTSMVELDGVPDEALLRAAVRDLQARHPRLRATVNPADDGPRWTLHDAGNPPAARLDYINTPGDVSTWQDAVHRDLNEDLDLRQGPGFRTGVVCDRERGSCRLYVTAHHAVGSGNLFMLHDLLQFYEDRHESPQECPPVEPLPFLSLGQNCTPVAPQREAPWDLLFRRWRHQRNTTLARRSPIPRIAGRRDPPAWEMQIFTPMQTASIVRACRRRKVSTLGVILAAGMLTQREALGRSDIVSVSGGPLDIRNQFTSPQGAITAGDLGNFMMRMIRPYQVTERSDIWQLAQRISGDTARALDRGLPRSVYMPRARKVTRPATERADSRDAEASAAGRPHIDVYQAGVAPLKPAYAGLEVGSCIQIVRRLQSPAAFLIRISAITLHNRLQVFVDPVEFIDPAFVTVFHQGLVAKLAEIAESG